MEAGNAAYHQLTFSDHVHELRKRLAWSAAIFMAAASGAYVYHSPIIQFLKQPLKGPLYYDNPAGNFNLIMEICFMTGFAVAVPVIVFNIIRFIEPAIEKRFRGHLIVVLSLLSLVLALCGAAFAYFIVLPISLHFFQGFKVEGVSALISAKQYLDYVIKCIIAFIALFQIPLVVLFVNFVRPLPPRTLLKYEKHVIVGSLIIALVLPFTYDPLTQFVIALPIIFLYNVSLFLVWIINRRSAKSKKIHHKTEPIQTTRLQHAAAPRPAYQFITKTPAASLPSAAPVAQPQRRSVEGLHSVSPSAVRPMASRSPHLAASVPSRGRYLDIAPKTGRRPSAHTHKGSKRSSVHFLDLRPAPPRQEPDIP